MSRATLDLLAGLLEAHRYDDADRLVSALHGELACGDQDAAGLLATARELCAACRQEHERTQEHWQAAADGAAAEARLRLKLALVLDRALTAGADGEPDEAPTAPSGLAVVARPGTDVRCLGPLQVLRDGHDLGPLPNRRAKSVFKYLLLHRGRPTPKGVLMDLFWPDAAPEAARNNLNVAVYALRRFLGGAGERDGTVVFRDDGYLLADALDVHTDLDEFDRRAAGAQAARARDDPATELAHLRAAAAVHRGVLFADDLYEEWAFPFRQRVQDRFVDVLERLAARHRAAGDQEARAGALRRILEVQPAHEEAHRALMRAYAALGRPHLAARQFEACVTALRDELDVDPSPATRALADELGTRQRRSAG